FFDCVDSVLCLLVISKFCFFFFQAEDGIRDFHVTGVQTCALPIFMMVAGTLFVTTSVLCAVAHDGPTLALWRFLGGVGVGMASRSEERRVGKECRSRWSPDESKKKRDKSDVIDYSTESRLDLESRA